MAYIRQILLSVVAAFLVLLSAAGTHADECTHVASNWHSTGFGAWKNETKADETGYLDLFFTEEQCQAREEPMCYDAVPEEHQSPGCLNFEEAARRLNERQNTLEPEVDPATNPDIETPPPPTADLGPDDAMDAKDIDRYWSRTFTASGLKTVDVRTLVDWANKWCYSAITQPTYDSSPCADLPTAADAWLRRHGFVTDEPSPQAQEEQPEQPVGPRPLVAPPSGKTKEKSGGGISVWIEYDMLGGFGFYFVNERKRDVTCEYSLQWIQASTTGQDIHEKKVADARRVDLGAGRAYQFIVKGGGPSSRFWVQPNSADYTLRCSK